LSGSGNLSGNSGARIVGLAPGAFSIVPKQVQLAVIPAETGIGSGEEEIESEDDDNDADQRIKHAE